MSESEIVEFLSANETGVLSLARDDDPYAVPISYGYDADTGTFYMRLVSTPESEKRAFLSSTPSARFVVYEENDDGTRYRSVLATGELREIDPDELSVSDIEQYGEARRPLFEIWGKGKGELDIQLYKLEPEEISGRRTEVERDLD